MAKTKTEEIAIVDFQQGFNDSETVFLTESQRQQYAASLAELAEKGEKVEITAEYYEFSEGVILDAIFVGKTEMSTEKGVVPAVRLLATDGKYYINANAMIVGNVGSLKIGTPVSLKCTGEKKSGKGTYSTFAISLLIPKR